MSKVHLCFTQRSSETETGLRGSFYWQQWGHSCVCIPLTIITTCLNCEREISLRGSFTIRHQFWWNVILASLLPICSRLVLHILTWITDFPWWFQPAARVTDLLLFRWGNNASGFRPWRWYFLHLESIQKCINVFFHCRLRRILQIWIFICLSNASFEPN